MAKRKKRRKGASGAPPWLIVALIAGGVAILIVVVVAVINSRPREPRPTVPVEPVVKVPPPPPVKPKAEDIEDNLKKVLADIDRRDPGWRYEELVSKLKVPENNGATQLTAVARRIPKGWPEVNLPDAITLSWARQNQARLRKDLDKVGPVRIEAHKLAEVTEGQFVIPSLARNPFATKIDHGLEVHGVVTLLLLDALVRANDKDAEGALESVQAMLNASNMLGDEPLTLAQFVRMSAHGRAAKAFVATLECEGAASENRLLKVQQAFEHAMNAPVLWTILRAERALTHDLHTKLANKTLRFGDLEQLQGQDEKNLGIILIPSHANWLALLTDLAEEVPQAPAHAWSERVKAVEQRHRNSRIVGLAADYQAVLKPAQKLQAELRCAVVAAAATRHGWAKGMLPTKANQLVPEFLTAIPKSPFANEPIALMFDASAQTLEIRAGSLHAIKLNAKQLIKRKG